MSKPIAPCKNCEDRHLGCHSTCQLYVDFEVANRKYNIDVAETKKKLWGNYTHASEKAMKKKKDKR